MLVSKVLNSVSRSWTTLAKLIWKKGLKLFPKASIRWLYIEHGPLILDLPIESSDFPQQTVGLPEVNPPETPVEVFEFPQLPRIPPVVVTPRLFGLEVRSADVADDFQLPKVPQPMMAWWLHGGWSWNPTHKKMLILMGDGGFYDIAIHQHIRCFPFLTHGDSQQLCYYTRG